MFKKILFCTSIMVAISMPSHVLAEITFCGDCNAIYSKGRWMNTQQVAPNRLRLEADPSGYRGLVTKVEVRPGDKVGKSSGERAEKSTMLGVSGRPLPVSTTTPPEFYALSVRLAPDWKGPDRNLVTGTWGTFFQLHAPDRIPGPPSLAMMVTDRFFLNILSGDASDPKNKVATYEFVDGTLNPGKWVDFVIQVKWSVTAGGEVIINRRDQDESEWQEVFFRRGLSNLRYWGNEPVGGHYWKSGYYRNESQSTNILWLGPIVRGSDRREVIQAAFAPK